MKFYPVLLQYCLNMKKLCLFFWIIQIGSPLFAQKPDCGNELINKDSSSVQRARMYETNIAAYLADPALVYRSEIIIPVVVHIVWYTPEQNVSDALVLSQIEALNRDFNAENADITRVPDEFKPFIGIGGIRFCLAAADPAGNRTTGITRRQADTILIGLSEKVFYTDKGGENAWDTEKYLNIWVADMGTQLAGFGSIPNESIPEKTGVAINYKFFGVNGHAKYGLGRTATHEIGHFLGLKHPWGDDTDCETDDEVADTPPQLNPHKGCPAYPQSSCTASDMFMNFMDYVNDPCMFLFTEGQKQRMLATLTLYRPGLLNTDVPYLQAPSSNALHIAIYPNPSNGLFTIACSPAALRIIHYSLFNNLGQIIAQKELLVNDVIPIDLSSFSSGIYIINIEGRGYKLVKL